MKLKSLVIAVTVLAGASVAVFLSQRPSAPVSADARLGQALVSRATIEQAAKFHLADQGKTVDLARQADGSWRVTSYHDLPADISKLSTLMGSLTEAKLQRLVTSNAERIARLEFKDTKLELRDQADKPLWALTLGKTAEAGGRYVRYDNEPKAYLANFSGWLDAESKNWADSQLLKLSADEIAAVEVGFPEGKPVKISRAKKDAAWTADSVPAGRQVNGTKVDSLLGTVGNLRFTDTTALDDAKALEAKQHERTLKLTAFDGKTYTITMGRKPEVKQLKPAAEKDAAPVANAGDKPKEEEAAASEPKAADATPPAPEYETIPAGPVFVSISSDDATAPINKLMQRRAFEISDYTFTSLPQKPEDLFEAVAAPAPTPVPVPPATTAEADGKNSAPRNP